MLRVALRPRFLGLLALMIAATLVCGLLATWQWHRAHRALEIAPPSSEVVALADIAAVGDPVTNEDSGRAVRVSGTYDPGEQVLVPGRRIDGTDAVIVVTALHVQQADGSDARLPVARGWMPAADAAGADGALDPAAVPTAPTGTVTVTGRLEASEAAQSGVGADGTIQEIATPLLVNVWGSPMYAGYVAETSAAEGLRPMPVATSAFSRGLNWQNIGYALQWVVFGVFFLYLWWRSVRTRYLDERAEAEELVRSRLSAAKAHTGGGETPGDGTAARPLEATSTASADAKEDSSADDTAAR